MSSGDITDYWVETPIIMGNPFESHLSVEKVDDFIPLTSQFGVEHPQTTPDELYIRLFGPMRSGMKQNPAPPSYTYAILDAAKVTNLPELLEEAGLEYRCFFKGELYKNLKNIAPWIVKLEDGNKFTRNLFTSSDSPWHVWDNEPGIYMRSPGSLDDMWRHFRKFVHLQDTNGKWFYFRFWDREAQHALLNACRARNSEILRFFISSPLNQPLSIYLQSACVMLHFNPSSTNSDMYNISPNNVLTSLMPFLQKERTNTDLTKIALEITPSGTQTETLSKVLDAL